MIYEWIKVSAKKEEEGKTLNRFNTIIGTFLYPSQKSTQIDIPAVAEI